MTRLENLAFYIFIPTDVIWPNTNLSSRLKDLFDADLVVHGVTRSKVYTRYIEDCTLSILMFCFFCMFNIIFPKIRHHSNANEMTWQVYGISGHYDLRPPTLRVDDPV